MGGRSGGEWRCRCRCVMLCHYARRRVCGVRYVLRPCYTAEWLEAGWLMRVTWVRFWVGGFLSALPVCVMGRVVGDWAWVLGLLCGGWRGILVQCIDALLCAFGRMYV